MAVLDDSRARWQDVDHAVAFEVAPALHCGLTRPTGVFEERRDVCFLGNDRKVDVAGFSAQSDMMSDGDRADDDDTW